MNVAPTNKTLKIAPKYYIAFLLGIYFLVGLFNLDRLPIAWNDEIQNLDPALVWHNTGYYCSPLWPNPGAESKFLSYPPLLEAWHCLWLFVGKSQWVVRLPFLIFQTIAALLLYRLVCNFLSTTSTESINESTNTLTIGHQQSQGPLNTSLSGIPIYSIGALFAALFLFDKSTGEIARSLRVETPIILILLLFIGQAIKQISQPRLLNSLFLGICLGALATAHLYTWPLVFAAIGLHLLWLSQKITTQKWQHLFVFFAGIIIPFLLFWVSVHPNLKDLTAQLFMQAEDHSGSSFLANIYGFFITRFIPYYLEQPYAIALHFIYWIAAIQICWKFLAPALSHLFSEKNLFGKPDPNNKPHNSSAVQQKLPAVFLSILYLSFAIPAAILMAPQHRYFPVQNLLGLLVLLASISDLSNNKIWIITSRKIQSLMNFQKSVIVVFNAFRFRKAIAYYTLATTMIMAPWLIRNATAIAQREQRNPNTAIAFLNKNLNQINTGEILGEPIANYWLAQSPNPKNWKYGFEFYPQHFKFSNKIPRFFLSRVKPNQLQFLKPIDSLHIPVKYAFTESLAHTYNGLYLYKIDSQLAWNKLTSKEVLKITSGH